MTDAARVSDSTLANAIRALAMDAVEAAKSGHPGKTTATIPQGVSHVHVVDQEKPHGCATRAFISRA